MERLFVRGRRGEPPEVVRERLQTWAQDLRDELGVEIGEATSWGSYANSHYEIDANDRGNWPDMADWLHHMSADDRRVLENRPAPTPSAGPADE